MITNSSLCSASQAYQASIAGPLVFTGTGSSFCCCCGWCWWWWWWWCYSPSDVDNPVSLSQRAALLSPTWNRPASCPLIGLPLAAPAFDWSQPTQGRLSASRRLSQFSWCWDLKQTRRARMTSLLTQHRTIVLHKPKKIFGSFLVNEKSKTPYSDATKVRRVHFYFSSQQWKYNYET